MLLVFHPGRGVKANGIRTNTLPSALCWRVIQGKYVEGLMARLTKATSAALTSTSVVRTSEESKLSQLDLSVLVIFASRRLCCPVNLPHSSSLFTYCWLPAYCCAGLFHLPLLHPLLLVCPGPLFFHSSNPLTTSALPRDFLLHQLSCGSTLLHECPLHINFRLASF